MYPNFSNKKFPISIKLLSYSIATTITLGTVVGIPREVAGETQSVQSVQQSAQLAEAKRLNNQVVQLYNQGKYDRAIPLAERALAIREKVLGKEHLDVAISLNNLAKLHDSQGSYAKAESLFLRSLAIEEKLLGKEHPNVATSLSSLAAVYESQGNYAASESFYLRSLAIREKVLGKEHLSVATTLNNLAVLYNSQKSYVKAESLFLRSLAIEEKVLGKEHPDVATTLNNLAILYDSQGSYAKAESLYLRSLAITEKALGKEHPDVATSLNYLALLYSSQGNYAASESFYLRSLAIREKVLGKEHPDVASSLNNLAALNQKKGNYAKAESLYLRSLAIDEKALGKEHPSVATSLNNLAGIYDSQGSYAKAESLYLRSLAIREKVLGKEHPDVANSLNGLALLNYSQGNYVKAESFFLRSIAIEEKVLGKEHPDLVTSLNNLAGLYESQGSYANAESLYLRSLAIGEKTLGKEHPNVADSLNGLAGLYKSQGSYAKAESLYLRSLAIREKVLGKEHPDVAISLNNLALLHYVQGSYAKAEPLYLRSLAIQEKVFGKEHPQVATILDNLGSLYDSQDKYKKAETYQLHSLAIREKVLGKKHPSVAVSLNNLGTFYLSQGNYTKAESFLLRSLGIFKKYLGKEHPDVADILNNLAIANWLKDDISGTTNFLTRGLEIEEKNLQLIYTVGSEQRKQNYAKTFNSSTHIAVSLALQEYAKNSTTAKLALTTVLRRKGRVLDAITDTVKILRAQLADNPEIETLFDSWLDVQQQLAKLVYSQQGEQKTDKIKKLEAQNERLEEQLSAKSAEFRKEIQPIKLKAIQAKIPKDAALIEIVQYDPLNPKLQLHSKTKVKPRYAAAILRSRGKPKWVDLGEAATIDKYVNDFRKALKSPKFYYKNQGEKVSRELDKLIMAPIRPLLGNARHLLLSPDGQLNLIPFEALKDEKNKYLVEGYSFSYLTTGRDLLRFDVKARQLSNPVIFADINYNKYQNIVVAKNRSTENKRSIDFSNIFFTPLPGTAVEGKEIQKILPSINLVAGKQATEATIKRLKTPSILHLATHGFFLPDQKADDKLKNSKAVKLENPLLRSGLALAGSNSRQNNSVEDGVLTALEVAGLNLRGTKLVVLSACETGLGDVQTGEGVYGLRRALVISGSQSQLLSLWAVSDNGTKDLMVKYYHNLKAGQGRHEAFREVQLEFIKSYKYNNPYYWASFIPSGNWREMKLVK